MGAPEDTMAAEEGRTTPPATYEPSLLGTIVRGLGYLGFLLFGTIAAVVVVSLWILSGDRIGDGESERVAQDPPSVGLFDDEERFVDDDDFDDQEAEFASDSIERPEFSDRGDIPGWVTLDDEAIDFADFPTPTFQAPLADLGDDRLREIEFFLPEGSGPIEFGIRNPDPIAIDGQGIAVRTDDQATSLRSSRAVIVQRPVECFDGNCRLFMWLSMGPQFLEFHPEAELLIWADDGSAVTIEAMTIQNYRDETFR